MTALKISPKSILTYAGFMSPKKVEEVQEKPQMTKETLGEKETLLAWKSPARPVQKGANQRFIRTGIVIGLVIAVVLALMQEFFLILVVSSIIFFSYKLINSPIETLEHELSTHGLRTNGELYYWYELRQFFFTQNTGTEMLAIDTIDKLPTRLYILFNPKDKEKIKDICEKYITYIVDEPLTKWDQAYFKIMSKLNFDSK